MGATNASQSNFLGQNAGKNAINAIVSNFIGNDAGIGAANAGDANFIGNSAGNGATDANASNFIGTSAGQGATGANNSNFIGQGAGQYATNATNSIFIGSGAGISATKAARSIFIGMGAGANDAITDATTQSILIGNETFTGGFKNSMALGTGAINTAEDEFMIGGAAGTLYDIVNPKYPQTRNDAAVTPPINFLYTDANGKFLSAPASNLAVEPWQVEGSGTKASLNTQNIYQMGKIGINNAGTLSDWLHIVAGNNEGITLQGNVHQTRTIRFSELANGGQGNIDWYKTGNGSLSASIRSVGIGSYAVKGLGFYTGNFADYTTDAVERMRVTEEGRIAIGTAAITDTAPLANNLLDVANGTVRVRDINTTTGLTTDNVVVADVNGVLKTIAKSTFATDLRVVGASNHITQDAGVGSNGTSVGTGIANIGIGNGTLGAITTGGNNIAIGQNALTSNQTGIENVAVGNGALSASTTAYNTAVGAQASLSNTTGDQNTAIGRAAMSANTTGSLNTALGMYALVAMAAGNGNVGVGYFAGRNLTAGNNNIFIGNGADFNVSATASNQLNIGNWIYGNNGQIGIGKAIPTNTLEVQSAAANTSGLTFTNLNNASPVTAVAAPLGVDATGKVVTIAASTSAAIRTEVANYTALLTDETILVDASTGSKVITLPAASAANKGKKYNVKKIAGSASNTVNVISLGGNIDDNVAATGVTGHLIYQGWTFQSEKTKEQGIKTKRGFWQF